MRTALKPGPSSEDMNQGMRQKFVRSLDLLGASPRRSPGNRFEFLAKRLCRYCDGVINLWSYESI
jgi:hypothetical protein